MRNFEMTSWPKVKETPAAVFTPASKVLVWVRPEEVAEEARVGDVCRAHNPADLLERRQVWRESSVGAEDLLVDHCADGEAVEAVGKRLPQLDIVPPLALVIEPVDPVDRRALVVPAQNEKVLGVLHLVRQQHADRLQRLLSTVHIVPQKQVV